MVSARITPPTKAIADINAEYAKQPKLMATAMKRNGSRMKSRWLKRLRVEPRKPPRGITKLMTPRQRRFVHALRRARGGGEYVRTHELIKGWDVILEAAEKGGGATITNENRAAEFAYGLRRQPFLVAIGWLDPKPLFEEFEKEYATVLEQTFLTIADPTAGVR